MLDNDALTYSQPKRGIDANSRHLSERALLTPDRAQKLDLLIHLLSNLKQSLIICGPEGIGKTTLLKTLQDSHQDIWRICLLQGSSSLSFENVVSQLSRFLKLNNSGGHFDLSSLRNFCSKQRVVLAIDDADQLLPGLINELIDLSESLSGLRLVFAMNYDECKQQADTETVFNSCHFIELPPLNQRQCMVYLQNLSAQPGALLSFNAITDELVEELYQETQGIPGKLLAELPKLGQYQSRRTQKLGLPLGMILILIVAGFAVKSLLPPSIQERLDAADSALPEPTQPDSTPIADEPEPVALEPAPAISTPLEFEDAEEEAITEDLGQIKELDSPGPEVVTDFANTEEIAEITAETIEAIEPAIDSEAVDTENIKLKAIAPKVPAPTTIKPKTTKKPPVTSSTEHTDQKPAATAQIKTEPNSDNSSWIMAQPADNYTIQLMVLSSEASVTRFLKKHAEYGDQLKYLTIGKSGQERYILIFGSFSSANAALEGRSNLPNDFNDGIVKRFKSLQKQSRRQ